MNKLIQVWTKSMYIFNKRQKARLGGLIVILIVEALFELAGVVSVYPFIALVLNPDMINSNVGLRWLYDLSGCKSDISFFTLIAGLIVLLYVAKNAFNAFASYTRLGFVYSTRREIGVRLMRSFMLEPYNFFLENNSSNLMRCIGDDVVLYFDMVLQCLYFISDGLLMLVFGAYLLYTDWLLTVVCVTVMALFVFIFVKWNKRKIAIYGQKTQEASGFMTKWLQQAFGGAKEIKILHREDFFVDNYEKYCATSNKMNQKFSYLNAIPHMVLECFCVAAILGVITVRINLGAEVQAFVPTMAVFAMALFRMFPRVSRINGSMNSVIFSFPFMESIYNAVKSMDEREKNNKKIEEQMGNNKNLTFNSEILLNNVHFSYPTSEEEILTDISFEIKKGQAIGLVGPSGAGKSTLVDIILGVLVPQEGYVLCDGVDIQSHIRDWSGYVGYIPQSIFLSDDSIRNNIAFGLLESEQDEQRINAAIEQAQLKEFIDSLPEGIDTKIGERGVRLSGGQRQRIGIARALYNNPEILVLDEATSALDNETEKAVMESVDSLLGHKTMVIIAHRITTVKNCDVIYRVNNRTVEKVSYEELK